MSDHTHHAGQRDITHDDVTFTIAVVGTTTDGMTTVEYARLLDNLIAQRLAEGRTIYVLADPNGPAAHWAASRRHEVEHPVGDHPVRAVCDVITSADAVVCVGDPEQFKLLLWLADQAGIPCRVVRGQGQRERLVGRATNLPDG